MKNQEKTNDLIELYLSDKLTDDELISFESEIASNPQLAKDVGLSKIVTDSLVHQYIENDNELIKSFYKKSLSVQDTAIFKTKYKKDAAFRKRCQIYEQLNKSTDSNLRIVSRNTRKFIRIVASMAAVLIVFLTVKSLFFTSQLQNNKLSVISEVVENKNASGNITIQEKNNKKDNQNAQVEEENTLEVIQKEPPRAEEVQKSEIEVLIDDYIAQKMDNNDSLTLVAFAEINETELPVSYNENLIEVTKVNMVLRTATLRINSPEKYDFLKNPVKFEWEEIEGEFTLTIKDNNAEKIWTKTVENCNSIVCDTTLDAGTYYWSVKVNNSIKKSPPPRQLFIISE